jgi:hypothetical protein
MLSGASGSDSTSAFVRSADEKKRKGVCEHIPMARPGKADEIAAVLTRLDLSTHRGDSSHTEWPQRTVQHHFLRRVWLSTVLNKCTHSCRRSLRSSHRRMQATSPARRSSPAAGVCALHVDVNAAPCPTSLRCRVPSAELLHDDVCRAFSRTLRML